MTTQERFRFEELSDGELLAAVKRLAGAERAATAQLIRCLGEIDARRLYLGQGCASLFAYCTRVLHLSEHAAYGRIAAARTARQFPAILPLLEEGAITLTTVTLLAGHLSADNCASTLDAARHRNKREVEELVARLRPAPDVPTILRKLPEPRRPLSSAPTAAAIADPPVASSAQESAPRPSSRPAPSAVLKPLSPARYKLQLTLRQETHERLLRARDLLRHAVPGGELEEVLDRALITLLKDLERVRCGAADRPRETAANTRPKDGRTIPAAVRRAVWARDGGQCAFVGAERRCGETGFLELHHVVPFADGGAASIENIQLRCRAHNANPPCLPVSATPWSDSFVCCRSGRGKRGDGRRRARHGLGPAALRAGQRADSTMRIRAVLRSETRAMRTRASGRAPGSSFRSP